MLPLYKAGQQRCYTLLKPFFYHRKQTKLFFNIFYSKAVGLEHLLHPSGPGLYGVVTHGFSESLLNLAGNLLQTGNSFRFPREYGFFKRAVSAEVHRTQIRTVAGPVLFTDVFDFFLFEVRVDRGSSVTGSRVKRRTTFFSSSGWRRGTSFSTIGCRILLMKKFWLTFVLSGTKYMRVTPLDHILAAYSVFFGYFCCRFFDLFRGTDLPSFR